MKNIFIILLLLFHINFNGQYHSFDSTSSYTGKNITVNLDMKLQFAGKIPQQNTFDLLLVDTRGDAQEMLNSQFIGYDIQIKLYKQIFASFQQHFAYDHVGFEEYDNVTNYTIAMDDINAWYTRYTFSLLYYFKINNSQLNINLGIQRTNSPDLITVIKKNRITNRWSLHDYWFSSYTSNHIEFNYIYKHIQIGAGYEFGGNIDFYDIGNSKFSLYYFHLNYNILKW